MLEIDWKPDRQKLKAFALISCVAFGAIGAWIFLRRAFLWMEIAPPTAAASAYVLWCLAAACLVLGFAAPGAVLPLYQLLTAVSLPIGYVLSRVLLGVAYFGIITPIGVTFRFMGRDPLERRFDPQAGTYWVKRAPSTDVARYFRQF